MSKENGYVANFQYRQNQVIEIKKLLDKGNKIVWGSHNWFYLGGKCFNGYTKEMVDKIRNNIPLGLSERQARVYTLGRYNWNG